MRIDSVTLYRVAMPLVTPHRTATLDVRALEHILVRLEGDGVVGWGECACPNEPYYLNETLETSWHVLSDFLVPQVIGRTWETVDDLVRFYAKVKGNTFPKAGLEIAAWDLLGRARDMPVARLLGGSRSTVPAGVTIGAETDHGRLLASVERALAAGFPRVKLKISPGHDVDVLDLVRTRFPDAPLMVDANSAYSLADLDRLRDLDGFGLLMIEQPFGASDFLEHAELQRALRTPVCLDESIRSFADASLAVRLESCRAVCVKIASVGGLLEARRIHDLCAAAGVALWCGGMLEYGVGRAANVALASLPGFVLPSDVAGSVRYYAEDIVEPPVTSPAGTTAVPERPGLGHDLIVSRLERFTTAQSAFVA